MRCDNLSGESECWVDQYRMCHASLLCQCHTLLDEDTITDCEGFLCAQKQLLCRILVKVIPHSVSLISSSEEGGGGNRISEDQIKSYLDETLGEGPRPMWGLPGGWGDYCASKSNAGQAHDMYINHPQIMDWQHALLRAQQSYCCSSSAAMHISNSKASSFVHYLYTIQGVVLDLSISSKTFATFPFVIIQVAFATLHDCCQ